MCSARPATNVPLLCCYSSGPRTDGERDELPGQIAAPSFETSPRPTVNKTPREMFEWHILGASKRMMEVERRLVEQLGAHPSATAELIE